MTSEFLEIVQSRNLQANKAIRCSILSKPNIVCIIYPIEFTKSQLSCRENVHRLMVMTFSSSPTKQNGSPVSSIQLTKNATVNVLRASTLVLIINLKLIVFILVNWPKINRLNNNEYLLHPSMIIYVLITKRIHSKT